MSLVNALRFSKFDGAMISDEEYWMYERRRVFFRDNIHNLIKPAMSNKYDIELFYGGIGDPYLHHEIINKAKKKIAVFFETNTLPQGKGYPIYELSKEVMNIVHATVRDRIEQKLRLLYGFGVDDFHRGYFIQNGKKYEIHQESVKKQVYNLITWSDKNNTVKSIFESRALIMGYDKEGGVQLFYVNIENQVLSFNSGDYDTIGKGIYGAGHVFANYTLQKTMDKRIKGCSRVEGMVTLIDSALTAAQTYNQVGGYFNIIYVNYKKDSKQRIQHIQGDRAKLATEIVAAMKKNFISIRDCYHLIKQLIFENISLSKIDGALFEKSKDSELLELYLRGYKIDIPTESSPEIPCTNTKKETPVYEAQNICTSK